MTALRCNKLRTAVSAALSLRLAATGVAFLAAACAQKRPEKQPPPVLVPVPLIRGVCEQVRPEQGSGHWDGQAHLLWNTEGAAVAIDCSFTVMADGLSTTIVRVDLRDERARGLRDFLASRPAH